MPRYHFPEFNGKTEAEILQSLKWAETDRSFHSNYSISYMTLPDVYPEYTVASWRWRDLTSFEHPYNKYMVVGDVCWGELPNIIANCAWHYHYPKWLLFRFRLDHFSHGARGGEYEDDYYDEDDYWCNSPARGDDLSNIEIESYYSWLIKHELIPEFDLTHFMNYSGGGYGYLDLDHFQNINTIYFACTMLRYMHEGQNLVRRMLTFDRLYDLDPYVNIVLAHYFADRCYNSGHCICDFGYWDEEAFGGYYWKKNSGNKPKIYEQYPTVFLARIARSMRIFIETSKSDKYLFRKATQEELDAKPYPRHHPYFEWEASVGKIFEKAPETTTPKTWRALLRLDTRRPLCQSGQSERTPKCSSKKKKAA